MKLAYVTFPPDALANTLAERLKKQYGEFSIEDADVVVAIGGDGIVLTALPQAQGKPVYGIKPPDSTSTAFTLNDFNENEDLVARIQRTGRFDIYPVMADVEYQNGQHTLLTAFNCVNLTYDSGQAAMLDLSDNFNGVARKRHLIGSGVVFATPFGSTGLNWSCGGRFARADAGARLIATGQDIRISIPGEKGLSKLLRSDSFEGGKIFDINCITSRGKRPLRIDTDGHTLRPESADNNFSKMKVWLSDKPGGQIAVTPHYTPDIYIRNAFRISAHKLEDGLIDAVNAVMKHIPAFMKHGL